MGASNFRNEREFWEKNPSMDKWMMERIKFIVVFFLFTVVYRGQSYKSKKQKLFSYEKYFFEPLTFYSV